MVRPPYQAAVRLSATAAGNWAYLDGTYSGQGVNLLALPFHRFLNVVYVWALGTLHDKDERERWLEELHSPLPGDDPQRDVDPEAEIAQLKDL